MKKLKDMVDWREALIYWPMAVVCILGLIFGCTTVENTYIMTPPEPRDTVQYLVCYNPDTSGLIKPFSQCEIFMRDSSLWSLNVGGIYRGVAVEGDTVFVLWGWMLDEVVVDTIIINDHTQVVIK